MQHHNKGFATIVIMIVCTMSVTLFLIGFRGVALLRQMAYESGGLLEKHKSVDAALYGVAHAAIELERKREWNGPFYLRCDHWPWRDKKGVLTVMMNPNSQAEYRVEGALEVGDTLIWRVRAILIIEQAQEAYIKEWQLY